MTPKLCPTKTSSSSHTRERLKRWRIDPEPEGSEFTLLVQYLDYQRETVLMKTEGLTQPQMVQNHPPSALTLAGPPSPGPVEESWMEVRFTGLPEREPWGGIDWEADPDWEFRTAEGVAPEELRDRYRVPWPASGVESWSPPRLGWTSAPRSRCGTAGTSHFDGCCCTS